MTTHIKSPSRRASGYTIRQLTEADIPAADELWTLAFANAWARDHGHKEMHRVFGAFEGKDLHAIVGVVDYKITFGDKIAECGGISGVATMPGQRSQKLINVLLEEACKEMNERGVAFSALYPFSYPFYERSGYAATHWEYKIQTRCAWLKQISKGGNAKRFRYVPKERAEEMLPVYDRWYRQFNLNLNRWEEKLKSMLTWPGRDWDWRLFVHDDGYILMNIHRGSEPKVLRVPEFVYLSDQAYLDGLALLAQMDTQFEEVKWIDYDVDALLKRGVPYPKPTINREPNMMTRVVNREAFERLLPKGLGKLRLSDPLGVTGDVTEGDIGVGEIVQLVTGFFEKPDPRCPDLHKAVANKPSFCVERY